MLDQAIPPIGVAQYTRYFDSPKVIIVDRDPRDLYVMNKTQWGSGYIPSDSVELFIQWYSMTRGMREKELSDTVLFMPFEALVYNYEHSLQRIMNFANLLEENHTKKLRCFNPELSKKNTMHFLRHPDLRNDIAKIESMLPQYCYKFPDNNLTVCGETFLIGKIHADAETVRRTGRFPAYLKKQTVSIFLYSSLFAAQCRFIKQRKGFKLFKLFVKIGLSLFVLPFELISDAVLYCLAAKQDKKIGGTNV
jgi:hypothetical protein